MATFNFHLGELPLEAQKIREEIRDFLNRELGDRSAAKRALSWGGFDRDFSRNVQVGSPAGQAAVLGRFASPYFVARSLRCSA